MQSSLDVHSSLKRETLKHNVVDRDNILIPPNWDSWGKIRVIREGFDVEGTSEAWSEAIHAATNARNVQRNHPVKNGTATQTRSAELPVEDAHWEKVLGAFNEAIKDPTPENPNISATKLSTDVQVRAANMQDFLSRQAENIERLRQEEEKAQASGGDGQRGTNGRMHGGMNDNFDTMNQVNEHIGPVKFNVGGIQVDAEDMLKSLRNKERDENAAVEKETAPKQAGFGAPDGSKQQNEALASFFAGLIKKGAAPKSNGR